jgi:hypothetical protein
MSPRALLLNELDAWGEAGKQAGFWWRDDDLGDPTAKLDPLLRVAEALDVEPLLAVEPRWATPDLPKVLKGRPARVAVHGWAHVDHQRGAGKKAEFGDARPLETLVEEARAGLERLLDLFGDTMLSCFVPPWNRMVPDLARLLPGAGYHAVSVFGDRPVDEENPGIDWVNTHVDVIDWRGDRRFIGSDAVAASITRELQRRRTMNDWDDEPIGLLTHHLEMHPDDWKGFWNLCDILMTHPTARMLSSSALFRKCGAHE